jgi:hypothetical protein
MVCLPEEILSLEKAIGVATKGGPLPDREIVTRAVARALAAESPELAGRYMKLISRYTRLLLAASERTTPS